MPEWPVGPEIAVPAGQLGPEGRWAESLVSLGLSPASAVSRLKEHVQERSPGKNLQRAVLTGTPSPELCSLEARRTLRKGAICGVLTLQGSLGKGTDCMFAGNTLGESFTQQVLLEAVLGLVVGTGTPAVDGTGGACPRNPGTCQSFGENKHYVISATAQYMVGTSLDPCMDYLL